ncbi:MAG: hypothetical protein JW944_12175 [Deltaproteobacteria bacterium]|nr:hypothetical protein [Deltaproteobacteria bacterium]
MMRLRPFFLTFPMVFCLLFWFPSHSFCETLRERNEALLQHLHMVHGLSVSQMDDIRNIFAQSGYLGQGNPEITRHPLTKGG